MINRFVLNQLRKEISQPEIDILLGPRQVGKTTILKELQRIAQTAGHKTAFFDLEQPQTLAEFNLPDKEIIEKITRAGDVIFLDEFQYIQNASKIFKAIFDSEKKTKIFCSGSSSLEIHKHLKESLAGRRFLYKVFPLQLAELRNHDPGCSLESYLRFGGMPALTHTNAEERKQQILNELLTTYILKDIKSLVKEENIRAFNHLLYLLAENQGQTISVHSLGNQVKLSSKAVERYLDILEATYVNYRIPSFSGNLGNELKKSTKTYLYDLGIRNAILKDFSATSERTDKGVLLETFVFLALNASIGPNAEIRFWRTKEGDEVDFILLKDRKPIPIEVKSRLTAAEIPRGLKKFLARHKSKNAYVVNENLDNTIRHDTCEVRFITFDDFEKAFTAAR